MAQNHPESLVRAPLAGFLAWLVPGLGHLYLGQRGRAVIFLVTITVTFWTGVAIGGVRNTVDPHERKLWFVAQLGTGGNALSAWAFHKAVDRGDPPSGPYLSSEVGVHYTGVAGLLNLLVILDAIGRAELSSIGRKLFSSSVRGAPE